MRIPTGLTTETGNLTHTSTGAVAADPALAGACAQAIVVTLFGVVGAIFLFAAINMFHRMAPVKVRKR
jgi:hypothetical protein